MSYKSLEWEADKNAKGRWYFRPRPHLLLGLTCLVLLLAGGLHWFSSFVDPGTAVFFELLGKLCLLTSVLATFAGLSQQRRAVSVIPASGTIVTKRQRLTGGYQLKLKNVQLSGRTVVSLWAVHHSGQEIVLIPGTFEERRAELEALQEQIKSGVSTTESLPPESVSYPLEGIIALVFGLLWAVGGFLWASELVWVVSDERGVLVWPFGLFIMTLGGLEIGGIKILESAKRREPGTLFGVFLLFVYAWFAWRSLQ